MAIIQSVPYPEYTTVQRDALTGVTEGFKIKNTTNNTIEMYSNGTWVVLGVVGGGISEELAIAYAVAL